MKKTSQLPKDDSLMENRDTLQYGEQSIDKLPHKSEDFADGPDEDPVLSSNEDDLEDESDVEDVDTEDVDMEDDGTPVLTEEDLEENGLTEEDAEDIEWEEKKEA